MSWPHGFHLRHIAIDPGAATRRHTRAEEEVILMHNGCLSVSTDDGDIDMLAGDVLSIPIGSRRSFSNRGEEPVEAYVVRGGDHPQAATLID
jgi:mannose-6-phosphate isomerase-like protein (cupin superfamily)